MFYKLLIRPILFLFPAEKAHHLTFNILRFLGKIPLKLWALGWLFRVNNKKLERVVAGIRFPNPVGLAAGFDKDAVAYRELSKFGFGFIEIGTVTPKPQEGNPKPRVFRLPKDQALINRMGFNNAGVKQAARQLSLNKGKVIIGGNIGKNKLTPNENAKEDYLICLRELFPYVHYFVVNISSPNTPGLRELQEKEPLRELLESVQAENNKLGIPKPVFLKIAPDISEGMADDIIEIVLQTQLAGIIVSNTTVGREGLHTDASSVEAIGSGGLSGKPVFQKSTALLSYISGKTDKKFAIIASGGIASADDALKKLAAGADLVQLYTGFIYEGPGLIRAINKAILKN